MRSRLLSAVAPATGTFVLARIVLWLAALGTEKSVWDVETWRQWDSAHYLSIAERGYVLISCREVPGQRPDEWCGNSGWMPGYPILVRAVGVTGLDLVTAGVLVSSVFALLTLVLVDVAFVRRETWRVRLATLGLAAFFPGFVYFHAAFPMSLAAFLQILMVRQLAREDWLSAGMAGWGLALSYTTGALAALPGAAAPWLRPSQGNWRERLRASAVSGGLCLAGAATVLLVHWWTTGAWNALLLSQHKYRRSAWFPLGTLLRLMKRMTWVEWDDPRMLDGAQAVLVACIVLSAAAVVLWRWRRASPLDLIALSCALVFWLGPMTSGPRGNAFYRTEALILPVVLVTRRLPFACQVILLVMSAIAGFGLARLFFQGRVV